jgi:hypothetical protein
MALCGATHVTSGFEQQRDKTRIPVPPEIATKIRFDSDLTCCKCRERGKPHQIHHIDEDASNNAESNLAVLCLECHNETQVAGGFGRKLDAVTVREYRDDWVARVKTRRETADLLAAQNMAETVSKNIEHSGSPRASRFPSHPAFRAYVFSLPTLLANARRQAQWMCPGESTVDMIERSNTAIEVVLQVLINLANWYPENHFGNQPADAYFSQYAAERFVWHRATLEPDGPGKSGTIVGPMTARAVLRDLQAAVRDIVSVHALSWKQTEVDEWLNRF